MDEAILEIVEFSDFQCPFCAMAVPVIDSLMARHGERVRIVFRHYPLPMHANAETAARAAVEAQRQGEFWAYHDILFRHQDALASVDLIGYADSLGMDVARFEEALSGNEHADRVAADVELGRSLGVRGTPTFFVNGYRVVGVPPMWVLEEAIQAFSAGIVEKRPL